MRLHMFLVGLMYLGGRLEFGFGNDIVVLVFSFYWFRGPQWRVFLVCL